MYKGEYNYTKRVEQRFPCGCHIDEMLDESYSITYCPLHKAAPELYEACDLVQRAWVGDGVDMATAVDACLLALAKVEVK